VPSLTAFRVGGLRGWRIVALAVMVAAAAIVAAGCGSSSDSSSTSSGGGSSTASGTSTTASSASGGVDMSYVQGQVDKFKQIPAFTQLPPVKAKDAAGKRVAAIPFSTGVPFIAQSTAAIGDALKLAGVKVQQFPSQGQLNQIQQAFGTAVGSKFDAIDTFSVDPGAITPQILSAKRAGIPVVIGHVTPVGDPVPPNAAAQTTAPFYESGRLMADYVIMHSKGNANVLVVTSNEQTPAPGTVSAIKDEFGKRCGDGCKTTVVNVPIADWATKLQTQVQSSLVKDPKINYIIELYDSAVQFILPGVKSANAASRVKIVTFNGTPFVLDEIRKSDIVIADVGESTTWLGWAIADETFRVLTGTAPVAEAHTPLRIFDDSNVSEAGDPAKLGQGYGDDYISGYKKTWGLG
jgi:ribose transport system substrate-binding protein